MTLALTALVACGDDTFLTEERNAVIAGDNGVPEASSNGNGGVKPGSSSGGDEGGRGPSGTGGKNGGGTGGIPGGSGGEPGSGTGVCRPVEGESLPARKAVTVDGPAVDPDTTKVKVTADSLWRDFNDTCGKSGCHGGANMPLAMSPTPFKLTRESFEQRPNLGEQALARILSPDPSRSMPPGSGDGSKRGENDPIRRLGERLAAWQQAGFPDEFEVAIEAPDDPKGGDLPEDPYRLTAELAASLTNIGSCLPDPATEKRLEEMRRKDALFEAVEDFEDLPETLVETDLISFDSEVLARRGIYSFAPSYTLFSDNASKMRHIRVPVGTSVAYRDDINDFDIPENTRFYKTFVKPVVDENGNVGYRKMETRLILSRRDEQLPDGTFQPRALKASYAWDEDERMARLVKDPFRNGKPFADRHCPYVTDERVTRDPQKNPVIERVSEACTYMTAEELEDPGSGSLRHYAIPSSQRCDECHMGSSSRSYVLGFNPFQVDRRPFGRDGVYIDHDHKPTKDELDQLRRLISYGVITGIEPGTARLEESQGDRLPRNKYELQAQAYMMGNCAFCHNPSGFPSVQNPLLKSFNMYPGREEGGIFQFPLDKFSARAALSASAQKTVRIPYIIPGFGNHPDLTAPGMQKVVTYNDGTFFGDIVANPADQPDYNASMQTLQLLAPWRSMIWRNVYTPFTYAESGAIFIHMPRNVPAFDCRAHRIMASWMLSIPAVLKGQAALKEEDQPYREVLPDDPAYGKEAAAGVTRAANYLRSVTGSHCPLDEDTVDPEVVLSPVTTNSAGQTFKLNPAPTDDATFNTPRLVQGLAKVFRDGVPQRAHWVPVDTTDAVGRWTPRRSNWKSVVITGEVPASTDPAARARVERAIDHITTIHLTPEQEAFSLTPVPLGLWHPECTDLAANSPTVAQLQEQGTAPMRRWLFEETTMLAAKRVHHQSRGEAVFRAICQNCHGRDADSRSPLATTILELTGGQTRVANFVDGIFGPRAAPGTYAEDEFLIGQGATPQEWQARYMLFMTLGGTEATIPEAALRLVAKSPFYGASVGADGVGGGANMLQSAAQLCQQLFDQVAWNVLPGMKFQATPKAGVLPFATTNGHYELWESLCSFQNEPIVRVFSVEKTTGVYFRFAYVGTQLYRSKDDAGRWVYPQTHPVGNQYGEVDLGIKPGNLMPWCVLATDEAQKAEARQRFAAEGIPEARMPFCPDALFRKAYGQDVNLVQIDASEDTDPATVFNFEFQERWKRRGAINAGLAAYYYLDRWTKGLLTPEQPFDGCRN